MMKRKNRGFTLIELLVTIAIISVISITAFVAVNSIIKNSKEKSLQLTYSSLKKTGVSISKELGDDFWSLSYNENEKDIYVSCISVQDMINMGYYKENEFDKINGIENNTYVIVRKDRNSKVIISEEIDTNGYCRGVFNNAKLEVTRYSPTKISVTASCGDGYIYYYSYKSETATNYSSPIKGNKNFTFTGLEENTEYELNVTCTKDSAISKTGNVKQKTGIKNEISFTNQCSNDSKNVTITYNFGDAHFFKTTSSGSIANEYQVVSCLKTDPNSCNNDIVTVIEKNTWYKVGNLINKEIIFKQNNNGDIYVTSIGEKYISNTNSKITTIDKYIPNIPTIISSDGITSGLWHKNNYNLTVSNGENPEDNTVCKKITYEYSKDNQYFTEIDEGTLSIKNEEKNVTYYFRSKNEAGNVSDSTGYVSNLDKTSPAAKISSTDMLKATSQTATLSCTDNVGVIGYYWGTKAPSTSTTYTSVTSTTNYSTTKTVSNAGTYYLSCKDVAGNISTSVSQIYNNYTVNNMLLTTTGTSETYTTDNYEQISTGTYIAPADTQITLTSVYTVPTGSNSNKFQAASIGNASTTVPAKTYNSYVTLPSKREDRVYSMWFSRNVINFKFKTNGGTLTSSTTNGTNTYTWSIDSDGYIVKTTDGTSTNTLKSISRGATSLNLPNYNNTEYLNITRTGYSAISGHEWICENGCIKTNQTFSQSQINYVSTDTICDTSSNDCTVTLKVNWEEAERINEYRCAESTLYYITTCSKSSGRCNYTKKDDVDDSGTVIRNTLDDNLTICANYQIDSNKYSKTINKAISLASTGSTIKLLNNLADDTTATFNKNVTFNTNGKTLTRNSTITINSGYTLTTTGTGGISSTGVNTFSVNGTLKITGGNYSTSSGSETSVVRIYSTGSLQLTDSSFISLNANNGGYCGYGIYSESSSTLNISATSEGISIYGSYYGIWAANSDVNVTSSYSTSSTGIYNWIMGKLGYAIYAKGNIVFGSANTSQSGGTSYYPWATSQSYTTNTKVFKVLYAEGTITMNSGSLYTTFKAGTYQSDGDKPTYTGTGDTYKGKTIGEFFSNKKISTSSGYGLHYFTASDGNVALRVCYGTCTYKD